ncbi:O-acetyltransferase [Ligilactobacillus salitolerans]|uniref:O-acetyltransferase n=1 Tax=Ligilactobacillus salitolerans TaxID=1808352 RepID=A0A401IQD6_9LACO|nr:acyltransferase family protein [Ligilactobacillus salitolerans]GBG93730.1 O-acetyltransferase [Ligilactobacillus salitolerans]
MSAKKRILWVDYAKCFGIIAVVSGHAINDVAGKGLDVAYNAIYWWHMPLFFMLGGFFLKKISHDYQGWTYLLGHRLRPLLIAYLLNGSILIILSHYFRDQSWDYTLFYFGRLLYGGSTLNNYLSVFWYLTAYILAVFLTTLLLSYVKPVWLQFSVAIGLFALGVTLQDITFMGKSDFPWDAQISLLAVFWMLLGYYVFRWFAKIKWNYKLIYAAAGTLFFAVLIYMYAVGKLDFVLWLKSSNIHSGWQAFVIPPILCLVVFIACEAIERAGGFLPLEFIGQNTDIIMFYHRAAFDLTTIVSFTDNWYFRIIIGLAAPILLAWIIQFFKNNKLRSAVKNSN